MPVDDSMEAESLRGALRNVLCNSSNYPKPVDIHILGRDMGPLIDKTTDAVLAWQRSRVPEAVAESWHYVNDWRNDDSELRIPDNDFGTDLAHHIDRLLDATRGAIRD